MSENYCHYEREEMLQYIPKDVCRILEVGCSAGNFGHSVKKMTGSDVWGVELNSEAASLASEKLDRVITGKIEDVIDELPVDYFDCAVFNDVLEHLYDPGDVLRKLKKILKPGSVIVASIPNVRYFWNIYELFVKKEWKYRDEGILDFTHIRFFTKKDIYRLFQDAEYEIESIEGLRGLNPYKFFIVNMLTFFTQSDMKYLQYAVVARM